MPAKNEAEPSKTKRRQPATTPDAREQQLIALAVEVAEEQMLARTASSQVITHYLKLGSTTEQLQKEKIRHDNLMLEAKIEELKSRTSGEDLVKQVLAKMKEYSGVDDDEDD